MDRKGWKLVASSSTTVESRRNPLVEDAVLGYMCLIMVIVTYNLY